MATRSLPALALLVVIAFSNPQPTPVAMLAPSDAAVIEWAEARFSGLGLALPEIEIVVFDDLRDCGGHVGMYYPGRQRLELCRVDQKSVLHELAHAWFDASLSDATRRAFVAHRGLAAWNDREDPWNMRATEHAAEIMVWALFETDTTLAWREGGVASRRLLTIPDSSPERLAAGFMVLTGQSVPGYRTSTTYDAVLDYSPEAMHPNR